MQSGNAKLLIGIVIGCVVTALIAVGAVTITKMNEKSKALEAQLEMLERMQQSNASRPVQVTVAPASTPAPVSQPQEPKSYVPEVSEAAYAAFATGQKLYDDGDYEDAVPYLRVAAEGGHILGGRLYGWCLLYGKGTPVNPKEGVFYLERAARDGDAEAQYELGYCYYAGQGVQVDYERAVYWYEQAVAQGNRHGLLNLGYCYHKGYGVEKDLERARELYIRAIEAGNSNARKRLNEVERELAG